MDFGATVLNGDNEKEKKKKFTSFIGRKSLAKTAAEVRLQLIKQKQEYLKETKKRVQLEWEINQEKKQIFQKEFEDKQNDLLECAKRLREIEESLKEFDQERRKQEEWMEYMKCDRLPSPSSASQMNSYIFVWTEIENDYQMPYCLKKTEEVMQLLNGFEDVINDPGPDRPPFFLENMKELKNLTRNLLQEHIDQAIFYLISRIETDMISINVTTSKYFAECKHFLLSLWAELITPIPWSRAKEKRNPLKVVFEEVEVMVIIPVSVLDIPKVMRAMWLKYDHWSDTCRTYASPPLPDFYRLNLYDLFLKEHKEKKNILRYRKNLEISIKNKVAALPTEPTLSQEIIAWDCEPQKALSDEIMSKEFEEEDAVGWNVKWIIEEFEVNLRERTFLGDLLLLEVLHQPPQPKDFRLKHSVTLRKESPKLKPIDFCVKYTPPKQTAEEGTEKHFEKRNSYFRRSELQKAAVDEEIKNLVVVKLKLCESVIWFERPQLANWDPDHSYWSTEYIHDVHFDEDERTVTFKTGRFGLIGFHVRRYCSLPYEDWSLEPNEESGINFYLKTSHSEFYFIIKEGKVCLNRMKNVRQKALNWIFGLYYKPAKLVEHLKKGGIDLFPAPDASHYIDKIQTKHIVLERNIYQVCGLFSKSFRFKRSKFNQATGRTNIVLQAQEVTKKNQVDFCLVQTNMYSSFVLDINEKSENYSPEKAPYMKTYADFFSLLQHNCTGPARRQVDATCYLLIHTIQEFLEYVRPISFS